MNYYENILLKIKEPYIRSSIQVLLYSFKIRCIYLFYTDKKQNKIFSLQII